MNLTFDSRLKLFAAAQKLKLNPTMEWNHSISLHNQHTPVIRITVPNINYSMLIALHDNKIWIFDTSTPYPANINKKNLRTSLRHALSSIGYSL